MKNKKFIIFFNSIFFAVLFIVIALLTIKQSAIKEYFSQSAFITSYIGEIHKGQKLQGRVTAHAEGFGSLSVRFNTFHRINTDSLIFRIKEIHARNWYYQHTYQTNQFQPDQYFPFGFPLIKDSTGKQYIFELESTNGKGKNSVAISRIFPQIFGTYIVPRTDKLTNFSLFITVFLITFRNIFVSLPTIVMLIGLYLFSFLISYLFMKVKENFKRKRQNFVKGIVEEIINNPIYFILLIGLFFRLILAVGPYNMDIINFAKDASLLFSGKWNVYLYQPAYNYSPVMYYIIGFIGIIPHFISFLPFHFIFRIFISGIDVLIFFVIMEIAKERKMSPLKTGILFFLNPVSILLSGHHGQFDNITVLFILLAILVNYKVKEGRRTFFEWVYLTLSIVIKHILIFLPLVFWRFEKKSLKNTLTLFSASIVVFLITFLPFLSAKQEILSHVFQYAGLQGFYGLSYYLNYWCNTCRFFNLDIMSIYRYVFIISVIVFSLFIRTKDLIKSILLVLLFFFTFTSGIGVQYFIIPIIFGVFFPSKWFYLYSGVVTLSIIGGLEQQFPFIVPGLSVISWNEVWIFSSLWFVSELIGVSKFLKKVYDTYIVQ